MARPNLCGVWCCLRPVTSTPPNTQGKVHRPRRDTETPWDTFFFQTTCSGAGLSSWHQVSQHSANRACLRHGDLKSCTELPWTKFPGRAIRQWRQWLKFCPVAGISEYRQVNTQWPCESRWLRFGVLRKTFLKDWCALFNDFVFWECSWSASDCA